MPTLLVVTDKSLARGGGVSLLPRLDRVAVDDRGPFEVRLVSPDGAERTAQAVIDIPHVRSAAPPMGMLRVLGVVPDEIPLGTRVER